MAYQSVDKLQKALAANVFHYAKDSKKAAGRALGTLVETITFYLLKSWGLEQHISIEKALSEYGNPEITHNVEYGLHPLLRTIKMKTDISHPPITSAKIHRLLKEVTPDFIGFQSVTNQLLDSNLILRNACTIGKTPKSNLLASLNNATGGGHPGYLIELYEQHTKPFAIFECKRVGVEEGMTKGPQTIEKAKQGAYVARSASSLQKISTESGEIYGIIYKSDNSFIVEPYEHLLHKVLQSSDAELLRRFILTVGVVSNHGNWFSAENQNKELKVLAQSYDWLIFLTDDGLSEFIETLLLTPSKEYKPIQNAFMASYSGQKTKNQFTKVKMNLEADTLLRHFFSINADRIACWFNVISPKAKQLKTLRTELDILSNKNWDKIL